MAWLFTLGIHLALYYLLYTGLSYKYPHTLGILLPLPILNGVFLYFYAVELMGNIRLNAKAITIHLLPFLLLIGLAVPFYMLSAREKVQVFQSGGSGFEWYSQLQLPLILISGFGYSLATVWQIYLHRKRIFNNFSNIEKIMLRWLEYLAIGMGMIWLLSVFFEDQIIFGGVVLFVLFIGLFGINQVPLIYS
ncbi:MAG TPA: hypothetical protein VL947_10115, partial [Cytophagales bacterium]|nr:hypothetical protein [Cytophagales bacterium]